MKRKSLAMLFSATIGYASFAATPAVAEEFVTIGTGGDQVIQRIGGHGGLSSWMTPRWTSGCLMRCSKHTNASPRLSAFGSTHVKIKKGDGPNRPS